MTSTGTGVSTAVRDVRAPTTTTSLSESGVAVSLKSTLIVCPAGTTTPHGERGAPQPGGVPRNPPAPADPLPGAFSSRFADRSQPGFEREPLELLERERQQQIDPPADQNERIPEGRALGHGVARSLGGVRHAPMGQDRLAGEDRARLLGAVAHRDHEVPRLPLQPVDTARGTAGPRDVVDRKS